MANCDSRTIHAATTQGAALYISFVAFCYIFAELGTFNDHMGTFHDHIPSLRRDRAQFLQIKHCHVALASASNQNPCTLLILVKDFSCGETLHIVTDGVLFLCG
jgi:hypothetical protein